MVRKEVINVKAVCNYCGPAKIKKLADQNYSGCNYCGPAKIKKLADQNYSSCNYCGPAKK